MKSDVWILSPVLHDWPDAERRTILKRCRERRGCVPGEPDAGIALLDIGTMMFGGEARQRIEVEYDELFAATGLGPARIVGTETAFPHFGGEAGAVRGRREKRLPAT